MAKSKKNKKINSDHGESCLCRKCRNREEAEWRKKNIKVTSHNWRSFTVEDEE